MSEISRPTPALTVADRVETMDAPTLLARVRDAVDRIRELHQRLAEEPDDGGPIEGELLRAIQNRRELAAQLGSATVRWIASGGDVSLHEGHAEPVEVAPAELALADPVAPPDPVALAAPAPAPAPPAPAPPDPVAAAGHVAPVEPQELSQPTESALDASDADASDLEPADEHREGAAVVDPAPPKAATGAMLQALATNGMSPNWSATRTPAARQRALRALLREIGKPERPRTLNRIHRAVAEVSATVSGMDRWLDQPQRIQQALIGLAASMARHLQDEQRKPLSQADSTLMGTVFSRMTKWSGEHRPGFVAGLSRANSPDSETWIQDARDWWAVLQQEASPEGEEPESTGAVIRDLEERLEDGGFDRKTLLALVKAAVKKGVSQSDPRLLSLLAPHRDAIRGAKGLKTLKTQLRQASLEAPAVVPVENLDRGVPPDWPLLDKTRGNVAVIVGGDDRPHAADRIQAAFEFATVEWETGQPRRAAALAERIRGGRSVDVVILLREFVSHKFPDMLGPACKEAGIPMVVVDRGYGVTQVRLAFERFLGGPSTK